MRYDGSTDHFAFVLTKSNEDFLRDFDVKRRCSGYVYTGCIWDTQQTVRFQCKEHVEKVLLRSLQRSVSAFAGRCGALSFSLEHESDCFCAPQFLNQAKGGGVDATQDAKVIQSKFRSGLRRLPPSQTQLPPP